MSARSGSRAAQAAVHVVRHRVPADAHLRVARAHALEPRQLGRPLAVRVGLGRVGLRLRQRPDGARHHAEARALDRGVRVARTSRRRPTGSAREGSCPRPRRGRRTVWYGAVRPACCFLVALGALGAGAPSGGPVRFDLGAPVGMATGLVQAQLAEKQCGQRSGHGATRSCASYTPPAANYGAYMPQYPTRVCARTSTARGGPGRTHAPPPRTGEGPVLVHSYDLFSQLRALGIRAHSWV